MPKLNAAKRNALPKSTFGMPGQRKFPMPDPAHAANAKARATQQVKAGRLSQTSAAKIRAKANKLLGAPGAPKGPRVPMVRDTDGDGE